MKTLAIDTATAALSVAVGDDSGIKGATLIQAGRQHGVIMVPAVKTLLDQVCWQPAELERLVVGVGPGSFTGLRMGLTLAKTWAVARGLPIETVSTLALMAAAAVNPVTSASIQEACLVIPVIDARRQTAYTAAYRITNQQVEPILKDRHQTWGDFLAEVAGLVTADTDTLSTQVTQLILVGQDLDQVDQRTPDQASFVALTQERFPELTVQVIDGLEAWPRSERVLQGCVSLTAVDEPAHLVPNYTHRTLAEEEWADRAHVNLEDEAYQGEALVRTTEA